MEGFNSEEKLPELKLFEFDVRCRSCSKISRIEWGNNHNMDEKEFRKFIRDNKSFTIIRNCTCSTDLIPFHDIIGMVKY